MKLGVQRKPDYIPQLKCNTFAMRTRSGLSSQWHSPVAIWPNIIPIGCHLFVNWLVSVAVCWTKARPWANDDHIIFSPVKKEKNKKKTYPVQFAEFCAGVHDIFLRHIAKANYNSMCRSHVSSIISCADHMSHLAQNTEKKCTSIQDLVYFYFHKLSPRDCMGRFLT